jgi:septum site-determining protein MinC
MSDSITATEQQACFQFKTSFSPCMILQMNRYDLEDFAKQLATTVSRAPNFFIGSPVVIDLELIKTLGTVDFSRIKQIILSNNMVPIGVRGGSVEQHTAAVTEGIPTIAIGKAKSTNEPAVEPTPSTKKTEKPEKIEKRQATKLITTPIRSGMQVYAKDADLVVIAPVSVGAELLADGNIHVYGPLRGRALAGIQGDTQARIFCRTLEAELVAIAGYYLVKEEMQRLSSHDSMVQIYLDNEVVKIETI